jgi:hypothetical protein
MAFTCPRCQRVSHDPQDERQGYCAACHDFTRVVVNVLAAGTFDRLAALPDAPWQCEAVSFSGQEVADGLERMSALTVSTASLAGRSLEVAGYLDLITDSQRNPATDSGDCGDWPGPWDVAPYGDAMEWHPGDSEW